MQPPRVHPTAIVEADVSIGAGTSVWDSVHIRFGTTLGERCIVGEKSYIAYDVTIGHRVKINAFVYICNAVTIEDGVMISAHTTFTNDRFPRATTPDLSEPLPSEPDEKTLSTFVRAGATIGAGCTVGCDLEIGRFAMVGMGSVVTKSVGDFHLVLGNPAHLVGTVCRCGTRTSAITDSAKTLSKQISCPSCNRLYQLNGTTVTELFPETA